MRCEVCGWRIKCSVVRQRRRRLENFSSASLIFWHLHVLIVWKTGSLNLLEPWGPLQGMFYLLPFLQTLMKINRCECRKVNTVCVTCVFSFSADNIPSEIDKNFLWKYRFLGWRNQRIGRKSFFHAGLRNVNEATKLHGVTPETTENFSEVCLQSEWTRNQWSLIRHTADSGNVPFISEQSDVRGKDCTLQVKFVCLRTLASSEIYRGINFLWTREDHSSQDAAQACNVKIRRFSSCRGADVPWTSPVWPSRRTQCMTIWSVTWVYSTLCCCCMIMTCVEVHVQDVPQLSPSIHNGARQSGKDKWQKVLQRPQNTSLLF